MVANQLKNSMFINNGEQHHRTGHRNPGYYSVNPNYRSGTFGDMTAYPIPAHRIAFRFRVVDLTADDDDDDIIVIY